MRRLFADRNYLALWRDDSTPPAEGLNAPVTHVSWFAARAYARSIDRRLPTQAEWEYVAGASETAFDGRSEPGFNQRILDWYARPPTKLPPVAGSGFRNVYGVFDLHGSIWEWVDDFNSALVSGESRGDSGLERSLFCGSGSLGSADPSDYAAFMRFAFRSSLAAAYTVQSLGFRCAMSNQER